MPIIYPWYSEVSVVYHNNSDCKTGDSIERKKHSPGKAGRRLCKECRRLNLLEVAAGVADIPSPPKR